MDGLRLALRLALPAIAYVLLATAAVVFFIWSSAELWEALLVVAGALLLLGLVFDRRQTARARRVSEHEETPS